MIITVIAEAINNRSKLTPIHILADHDRDDGKWILRMDEVLIP